MLIFILAQASQTNPVPPEERALISLLLIALILSIGLLVIIGLTVAWRRHIIRQRALEEAHDERDHHLPKPDAWATAAQRIDADTPDPDQAHISSYPPDEAPDDEWPPDEPPGDEDDDFPFRDEEDDDRPLGT